MKKFILLLLLAAIGTLAVSAYRGEADGIFARFRAWLRPMIEEAKGKLASQPGSGAPKPALGAGLSGVIDVAKSTFHCGYGDEEIAKVVQTYSPDRAGLEAVAEILRHAGLLTNFKVLAGDVPNAAAFLYDGDRTIVYSNAWLKKLTDSAESKWAIYAVLAHEIAHHLNGDTMTKAGTYTQRTAEQNHKQELAADYWAGFALAKLGASLDETTAAVRIYGGRGSHSHPDKARRIEAHTNGWMKGREGVAEAETPSKLSDELIKLQHEIGRHAEHYGPGHLQVAGQEVPCVVQYKLLFVDRTMRVKGILYNGATRDVSIVEWNLDPRDGRPHHVTQARTGVIEGAECFRVSVANAGDFLYSVEPDAKGSRDPAAFAKLLQRYVEAGAR
jgi:hypothetical protein